MPHQIYNNKNANIKKKVNHQRASSVLAPKRAPSKIQSNRKKTKGDQNSNKKSKDSKGFSSLLSSKMSRTNSTNKVGVRPSSEYVFNKIKSISIYNHSKKI